jgi:hypothetical protein
LSLIEAVNTELYTSYATGCKIITREDLWVLLMCEAGLKRGLVDPDHRHSEGERGLLPLPENIRYWNGPTAPPWNKPMPLATNLRHFSLYLGQLKNKAAASANGMQMYRDLFRQSGIGGNAVREAKVLAGVVHGYFYSATYSDGHVPYAHLITSYQTDVPLVQMMAGTTYRHAGDGVQLQPGPGAA